jgi:hypothetical protein
MASAPDRCAVWLRRMGDAKVSSRVLAGGKVKVVAQFAEMLMWGQPPRLSAERSEAASSSLPAN